MVQTTVDIPEKVEIELQRQRIEEGIKSKKKMIEKIVEDWYNARK